MVTHTHTQNGICIRIFFLLEFSHFDILIVVTNYFISLVLVMTIESNYFGYRSLLRFRLGIREIHR